MENSYAHYSPCIVYQFNQDSSSKGVSLSDDEKKLFPLAEDHWINQPVRTCELVKKNYSSEDNWINQPHLSPKASLFGWIHGS